MSGPNTEYKPREEVINLMREVDRITGRYSISVEGYKPPITIDEIIWDIKAGTPFGKSFYAFLKHLYEHTKKVSDSKYYQKVSQDLVLSLPRLYIKSDIN